MATITKTPSGTWKAIIRKQGWPTTIKTFRTKRDASDWARCIEDEMVRGVYIRRTVAEHLLFSDALERYGKEVTPTKKQSTQIREVRRFANLIKEFGQYSLAAITPAMVASYRDKKLADGLAANSVRLDLALIGHLFTTAIQEWGTGLVVNPVKLIKKPSPGKARERRLSSDEEAVLMKAITEYSNPMLKWIVVIAIQTGMRHSEIINLKRNQIDIERRIIVLYDTKNGDSRTVPLTLAAAEAIRCALENPLTPKDKDDYVFCGGRGRTGFRKPYVISSIWNKIIKKINLEDFHFHDLRHEAVSRLVEAGFSDQEVVSISGHKSMQMLKRYTHLRTESLIEKLDKLTKQ